MKRIIIVLVVSTFVAAFSRAADPAPAKPADKQEQKTGEVKVEAKPVADKAAKPDEAGKDKAEQKPMPGVNTNKVVFTNLNMKASYILGLQNGSTMMMDGGDLIDPEMVVMGIRDVFYRYKPLLDQEEAESIMKKFTQAVQEYEAVKQRKEAEDNKKNGLAFLEENKKKEGVKALESGLQYKVIRDGAGDSPTEDDRVAIHFRARNIAGIEFSNSYKHKEPVTVPVRSQIRAWREALVMMKPGAKWELYVPSDLAYGTREVGKGVGPNSTLIFEIELVRVEGQPKKEAKK